MLRQDLLLLHQQQLLDYHDKMQCSLHKKNVKLPLNGQQNRLFCNIAAKLKRVGRVGKRCMFLVLPPTFKPVVQQISLLQVE